MASKFGNSVHQFHPYPTPSSREWANARRRFILRALGLAIILAIVALWLALPAASTTGDSRQTSNSQKPSPATFNVANGSTTQPKSSVSAPMSTDVTNSTNSSTSSAGNASSSSMNVSVNGQPIDIPDNGSTSQTITNPDGSTTNISASQSSTGSNYNSSFTSITQSTTNSTFQSDVDQSSGP